MSPPCTAEPDAAAVAAGERGLSVSEMAEVAVEEVAGAVETTTRRRRETEDE